MNFAELPADVRQWIISAATRRLDDKITAELYGVSTIEEARFRGIINQLNRRLDEFYIPSLYRFF